MPLQQTLGIPLPDIGDHCEILRLGAVSKQLALLFPHADRHPTQRTKFLLFFQLRPVVRHLGTVALRLALLPIGFPGLLR